MTDNELADKWIKELTDAGYTPDQMIEVFRLAKKKYDYMNLKKTSNHEQGGA